jgi:hypothetical protein
VRLRARWIAVVLTGVVAVAAAFSFAPNEVPAAPPPVRLDGEIVESETSGTELVVVPFPSVELGRPVSDATPTTPTTATTVPVDDPVVSVDEDSPDVVASPDQAPPPEPPSPDSADSVDDSAEPVSVDSPDD